MMKQYSFYLLSNGRFLGQTFSGNQSDIVPNTPEGAAAVVGDYDHLSQKVDLATGLVVEWQPPQPANDMFRTWTWDVATKRWDAVPTTAGLARLVRRERDRRMGSTDWVAVRAMELGQTIPLVWIQYRRALRDLTDQPGFPATVVWPEEPPS